MKKSLSLILVVLLVATTLFGCSQPAPAAKAETLKGTGKGYGGDVTVTVTKEGDKITKVEAVGAKETEGIGSKAIKELPAKIVAANGTKVDVIAGATVSSKALIYAVNNALDAKTYPFPPKEEAPAVVAKPVAKGTAGEIVKFGLGQNISIAKSTDATAEKTATAQADVTIASVGFDKDGKVASVNIDVAQTKVAFDKDMKVTTDKNAEVKSKKDIGKDYGLAKASTLKLEWFEQAANLENWMTGKTVAEIKALKVKERDASHKNVPDVPELTSSVTITVESYQAVVKEALAKAK